MHDPIELKRMSLEQLRTLIQPLNDKMQRGEELTSEEREERERILSAVQFKIDEQQHQDVDEAARTRREHERRREDVEREPFWFRKAW